MFDDSTQNLLAEIEAMERVRNDHLSDFEGFKRRACGPGYFKTFVGEYDPENYVHEYLTLAGPQTCFNAPRVRITSRIPEVQNVTARNMEFARNRWIRDTSYRKHLVKVNRSMLMRWAVSMVTPEPASGPNPAYRPTVRRILQERAFTDHQGDDIDDFRIRGHLTVISKSALLERAKNETGWNVDLIKAMTPGAGMDRARRLGLEMSPLRDDLGFYEVFIPEIEGTTEENFHGSIYTVAFATGGDGEPGRKYLREPRPFYGPPTGPYVYWGVYGMDGYVYPLSPLAAVEGQGRDANQHRRVMQRNAAGYKRLLLVDKKDTTLLERIKTGLHDFVYGVTNLEKQAVVPQEVGGITQHDVAYCSISKGTLDQSLAMNDAQRGNVTGVGTASENIIADAKSNARMDFIKQQFTDGVRDEQKLCAWYDYHDKRVKYELPGQGAFTGGNTDGEQRKKLLEEARPQLSAEEFAQLEALVIPTFDDLELDIEPFSVERTSEATRQAQSALVLNLATSVAPLMPQLPFVNWKRVVDMLGDTANIPDLGQIIDVDALLAATAQQQQMQSMQPAASPRIQSGQRVTPTSNGTPKSTNPPPSMNGKRGAGADVPVRAG